MQIHHGGNGPSIGLPAQLASSQAAPPAAVHGTSDERQIGGVKVVGGHADQLTSLAARLKDVPTTRGDVVHQVRERIEQGHYFTRDAAERTAASILGK